MCVWKRQKGVNAERLQHMVATAHYVSVALGIRWRLHRERGARRPYTGSVCASLPRPAS